MDSSGTGTAASRRCSTRRTGESAASAAGRSFSARVRSRRPRLLLHTGLANGSGQVGRNYMGHVATQVWGTFDHEVRMNRGYPSSLITEDFIRPEDADFAGGYLIQSLGVVPVTFANAVARGRGLWGQPLLDYLGRYNHLAGIGINGETLPCDANVLALSDETDARGMRKARIDFGYSTNENRLNVHATQVMREPLGGGRRPGHLGTGARRPHPRHLSDGPRRRHGGRRSARAQLEIDNLWISDGSTFPSSLAANPALTIMALALRTAERFLAVGAPGLEVLRRHRAVEAGSLGGLDVRKTRSV